MRRSRSRFLHREAFGLERQRQLLIPILAVKRITRPPSRHGAAKATTTFSTISSTSLRSLTSVSSTYLVATNATRRVGLADGTQQAPSNVLKHRIPGCTAQRVVDRLEVVEVHEEDSQPRAMPLAYRDSVVASIQERASCFASNVGSTDAMTSGECVAATN